MMSPETRRLLNPAFVATLIGAAALGYEENVEGGLPVIYAFLVPPLVLHKETRDVIPKVITSKLPQWIHTNSANIAFLPNHIRELQPSIRHSIVVGVHFNILTINSMGKIEPHENHNFSSLPDEAKKSVEISDIVKRSNFLGRWLAVSGNQPTVLSILGIGI